MVFVMSTIAREGAERICEVLDEKSDLTNCESPLETVPDGSISFEHVNFSYSKTADKLCLDDIMMVLVIISAILTFVALLSYIPGTLKQFKEKKESKSN